MCCYKTLYYSTDAGYVVLCTVCNNLQIGYGNLLITFHEKDLPSFIGWLKRIENTLPEIGDGYEDVKSIAVPTPCDGLKLLLSANELRQFNQMLDYTDTELKTHGLMRLFEINT